MHELERLFLLEGVVAALRFNEDGTVASATGELDELDVELAAELCHANSHFMMHTSDMFLTLSGTEAWVPRGWMMAGDALSVCGLADVACFVRNGEVSFNDVFRTLSEIDVPDMR